MEVDLTPHTRCIPLCGRNSCKLFIHLHDGKIDYIYFDIKSVFKLIEQICRRKWMDLLSIKRKYKQNGKKVMVTH